MVISSDGQEGMGHVSVLVELSKTSWSGKGICRKFPASDQGIGGGHIQKPIEGYGRFGVTPNDRLEILGAVILGFGIWILVDKSSFIAVLQSSSYSINVGSYILIAIGGVTMIMGFLGCVGAVNEIRCLLGL
ncbi:CD82 antigen-like, partial [Mantella aurantiaca]